MGDEEQKAAKRNIAAYYIQNSPAGEVDEVIADVKKIVDEDVLPEGALIGILREYNENNLITGPDPDGVPCMVSPHGRVGEDLYLDPASGRVMRFDHRRRRFTEVSEQKQVLSERINAYRVSIEREVKAYVDSSYKASKCVFAVYGADSGVITVCLSAANVHLGNFWTGSWRGVYQINVSSQTTVELKTDIKINVHYFEDGNVQLHTKFPARNSVQVSDEKKTAAAVGKVMRQLETEFQANLEQMYIEMHSHTFKQMRRFYPMNKQPMTWNLAAHRMAGEIGGA